MTSGVMSLSKTEWRQVSGIAARIDWARHASDQYAALEDGLSDRAAMALRQLLRLM